MTIDGFAAEVPAVIAGPVDGGVAGSSPEQAVSSTAAATAVVADRATDEFRRGGRRSRSRAERRTGRGGSEPGTGEVPDAVTLSTVHRVAGRRRPSRRQEDDEPLPDEPEPPLDAVDLAAGLLSPDELDPDDPDDPDDEDAEESDLDSVDFFSAGLSASVELLPLPPVRESVR